MADLSSIWVHRVGNVISGYCIRLLVILFSALAVTRPKVHKKALVSYVGCGLVWSAVELAIVLVGNRAGSDDIDSKYMISLNCMRVSTKNANIVPF